jgi:hypothetical protein
MSDGLNSVEKRTIPTSVSELLTASLSAPLGFLHLLMALSLYFLWDMFGID